MSIYYYRTDFGIGGVGDIRYNEFGGSAKLVVDPNASINVNELLYADFTTQLQPPLVGGWTYPFVWTCAVSQSTTAKDKSRKSFSSNPIRYDFGHLTASDSIGVSWDAVMCFEDQKTPVFRSYVTDGNPNPGGLPVDFETPLEVNTVLGWNTSTQSSNPVIISQYRASTLNLYSRVNEPMSVVINYYANLGFDAATILLYQRLVGIYP